LSSFPKNFQLSDFSVTEPKSGAALVIVQDYVKMTVQVSRKLKLEFSIAETHYPINTRREPR